MVATSTVETQVGSTPDFTLSPALEAFDWEKRNYLPIIQERVSRLLALQSPAPAKELPGGQTLTQGQHLLLALRIHYKTHPIDFIQDWVTTFDPRLMGQEGKTAFVPMVLYPRQREFIQWLYDRWRAGEDGVVEKSREMGISWLCMAFAIWMWLFHSGAKVGFGSYKEVKVDKIGDPDSLFEKGRILFRNLPTEFLPAGYKEDTNAPFMKFLNPENGSSITGEAGDQIGRGGRASIYFIDEAAFLEHPDRVESALSQTTNVKIWVSTANGMGNPFYRKVTSGKFPVFRFHWRQDPRKNDAWYAEQKRRLEPHILAQEVDIDYTASIERIVIPNRWVRSAVDLNRLIDWPVFKHGIAGVDVGGGGSGKSTYICRFGPFVDPVKAWSDRDPSYTALKAMQYAREDAVDALNYDPLGVGAGTSGVFEREKKWEVEQRDTKQGVETTYGYVLVNAINVGETASYDIWPDNKRANEKFANIRAEVWWIMRDRLQKSHEHWLFLRGEEGGVKHPLDELLVMPDDPILIAQLSAPTWDRTNSGKILIESKRAMAARGVLSPDYADALALTFAPATLSGDFVAADLGGLI